MNHARIRVVLLLIAALLVARIGGVHVHLHGGEHAAPSEIHLVDAGLHDDHHDETVLHADVEVQLSGAIAKIGKLGFDLPVLIAVLLLAGLLWLPALANFSRAAEIYAPRARRYLRPPLRGPPR